MSAVLTRNHFSVSRAAEYFSVGELQAQTGQPADGFWHVALKELIDNALDAAETAGAAPQISVNYSRKADRLLLAVSDNGHGIPEPVISALLDFSTRTSDKAAYRAPTRGAQGNALKTLIGIPAALGDDRAKLIIETQGNRHTISAWITPAGEVKHTRTVEACKESGTTVAIEIPGDEDTDWQPERYAVGYALFNPHAQIQIHGFDAVIEQAESSEPEILNLSFMPTSGERWRKFGPTDLTAASWYARDEFERLAHLKAAIHPGLSVRDLAREFRGQSRRLREIIKAVPASTISELVDDPAALAQLHETLCQVSSPKPDILGRVGAEHYRQCLDERYGIKPDRFWYRHQATEIDGLPFVVEIAIAETDQPGERFYGLNYSVPFSDPLSSVWFGISHGLNGTLSEQGVYNGTRDGRPLSTAAVVHLIMPRLPSLDRGKSRLALNTKQRAIVAETIERACKTLSKEWDQHKRQRRRDNRPAPRLASALPTKKEAVFSILLDTYRRATENEALYITARDLYYAIRPAYNRMDVRASKRGEELEFNYFAQNLIPAFRRDVHDLPMVDYKARGTLYDPHSDTETPIGDKELRDWTFPPWTFNKLLFIEKEGVWETLKQVGGIDFAKRWDMAIICSEGFSTTAVRKLMARAQQAEGYQLFVWHDADPAGYNIARTLAEETKRMPDHRVEVHDLGLFLEPAIEAGYQSETFTRSSELASTLTLTDYERKRFTGDKRNIGYEKAEWINCTRVEINAVPIRERIAYLEAQLARIPDLLPKVQPPASVLSDRARSLAEQRITEQVRAEVERRLDLDAIVTAAVQQLAPLPDFNGEAVHRLIERTLEQAPAQGWRDALGRIVGKRIKRRVGHERLQAAVNDAIAEQRGAA